MLLSKFIKILIFFSLSSLSTFAAAGWTQVSIGESHTTYIDPETIKNINGYVRVWVLYDYRVPQVISGTSNGSITSLQEFDCKEDRIRSLSATFYSKKMGGGEINHVDSTRGDWVYIQPAALSANIVKTLCK